MRADSRKRGAAKATRGTGPRSWLPPLAIPMVTAAVFAPCLANGFVDYDDPVHMPLCLGDLPSPRFERADGTVRERVARLDPADELARRNLMRAEEMK